MLRELPDYSKELGGALVYLKTRAGIVLRDWNRSARTEDVEEGESTLGRLIADCEYLELIRDGLILTLY